MQVQEEAKLQQAGLGVGRPPDPVQRPPGIPAVGGGQPVGMVAMQQHHGGTPQQAGMPQQQAMAGMVGGGQQWRPGMQQQPPGALQQQQQRPMYLQNQGQRQTMQSLQQLIQVTVLIYINFINLAVFPLQIPNNSISSFIYKISISLVNNY